MRRTATRSENTATSTPRENRKGRLRGKAAMGALALAVGLTGAVVATSAAADPTGSSTRAAETRTGAGGSEQLRVQHYGVRFSPLNVVDVPPRAQSDGDYEAGDYVVFSDTLLNHAGERIGTEAGSGLLTKVTSTGFQLHYTLGIRLPGGRLTAEGLSTNAPTKRLVLTGGTGRYLGAQGRLVLVEHRDGTGTLTIAWRSR